VALRKPRGKLPPAIIVDIDETLVDNSPNAARDILAARPYSSANWTKWVKEERATALAGAIDFLRYTHQRGVAIFYISNRTAGEELRPTYHNLRKLGFPVQYSHLLFKTDTSGKQARRDKVARTHHIILLMGDNLSDFAPQFDKKSSEARNHWVDHYRNRFGYDFIVLPNPVYGDWDGALYQHSKILTEEQKYQIRRNYLKKMAR
jgi:5'-nucleotidase (lipoprotein e(P4) family)